MASILCSYFKLLYFFGSLFDWCICSLLVSQVLLVLFWLSCGFSHLDWPLHYAIVADGELTLKAKDQIDLRGFVS